MREPRFYEAPNCATVGGDYWFPEVESGGITQAEAKTAKAICGSCIHKIECSEWGIHKERFGIWGGLTDMDRRYIRRERGIRVNQGENNA